MMVEPASLHDDGFDSWLADLPAVTLEELTHAAALQTRVDRKYLISRTELDDLTLALLPDTFASRTPASAPDAPITSRSAVRALEIGGRRHLGYWSTYFDTEQLHLFLGAARRRPHRFKVRVRTYLDTGSTFLEVKTRNRRGQTVKSRVPTTVSSHDQLSQDDRLFVATTLADKLERQQRTAAGRLELERELEPMISDLRPTLTTEYQRTTLLVADNSRATIDHGLCVTSHDGTSRHLVDHVVVETKSSRRPSPIDRLLWDRGHRPVVFSKYGTGLVLLYPELPGSKWNRVLRQQLEWLPTRSGVQQIHGRLSANSQQLVVY